MYGLAQLLDITLKDEHLFEAGMMLESVKDELFKELTSKLADRGIKVLVLDEAQRNKDLVVYLIKSDAG